MSSKNIYAKRSNIYSPSDSGIAFLLTLIVPQIIMILVAIICSNLTGLPMTTAEEGTKSFANIYKFAYTLICAIIPQIAFLIVFVFVSEKRKVNYKVANQINFKISPVVLLCVMAIGIVAMFGFSPLINMLDSFTSSLGYKSSTSNIDISTFWKFFASIFYIALLPAICEELIFRGIITNGLKKFGMWTAVVLSAILFALMHQNLQQLVYQLVLGGIMAYIAIKTGSIIYTMILHFFNNFVILLMSYLQGDNISKIDYSNAWNVIYPILLVLAALAIIFGLLVFINYLLKKQKQKFAMAVNNKNGNIADEKVSPKEALNEDMHASQRNENSDSQNKPKVNFEIDADKTDKFYKNVYLITALVAGIVFWIFAVISSFK